MKKIFKIILIISALAPLAVAQANGDNLVVEFEQTPLFKEANFLPGNEVVRWIKVTNNAAESKNIITEAINTSDPDGLGDMLNLVVKKGAQELYNDSLADFFSAGEVPLSSISGNGGSAQYDFIISFQNTSNNNYQGKTIGFDILIGFQGEEGGGGDDGENGNGIVYYGGGGGGGANGPPGLSIQNESVKIIEQEQTSVTIAWDTSYLSTSQVIYASDGENHTLNLSDNTGTPPLYGYAHTTAEFDTAVRVVHHSVTINGLIPGTTYYFRAISHGSLAVSYEKTFSTLTSGESAGNVALGSKIIAGVSGGNGEAERGGEKPDASVEEEKENLTEGIEKNSQETIFPEEGAQTSFAGEQMASVFDSIKGNLIWLIMLIILTAISMAYFVSKKKKETGIS